MPVPVALLVGLATCSTSVLLVAAGSIKVLRPQPAAGSLRRASGWLMRVSQHRLDRTARAVGALELLVGAAAMLVAGRLAVVFAALVVALFAAFVGLTRSARKRGVSCGCWGSLSDGPASDNEVNRRALFVAIALTTFVARITDPSIPQVRWTVAMGVMIAGLAAGALLATESMPRRFGHLGAGATFGVQPVVATRQKIASRRFRRAAIARMRGDADVVKVASQIRAGSRLAWSQARVTQPPDRPPDDVVDNFLVAVPGDGVSLRIVVSNGRTLMVIGESDIEVVTLGAFRLTVTAKRSAAKSSAV